MKRWTSWCAVLAMLAIPVGLGACKSRARSRTTPTYAATGSPGGSPGVAAVPQAGYPNEFDAAGYPPPPPPLTSEPVPSLSQADVTAAREAADLARRRGDDLERQLEAERHSLEQTQDALRDVESRLADLEPPPAGAVTVPDMEAPAPDATTRLFDFLRSHSVDDVEREGDMIIVRCTNSFKAGSDKLKADVQLMTTLNATADALARHSGASVAVVGHSDGDPIKKSPWPSNDALSLARAQRVAQVLADNGVDQNRISIDGRGFREPLVNPEVGRADKARNRRVEIMIRP